MHERAATVRDAARARGRHTGWPPRSAAPADRREARQVRAPRTVGESIADLVRSFAVSPATLHRALAQEATFPVSGTGGMTAGSLSQAATGHDADR